MYNIFRGQYHNLIYTNTIYTPIRKSGYEKMPHKILIFYAASFHCIYKQ